MINTLIILISAQLLCWGKPLPLQKIKLPPGFKISLFAEDIKNARGMTFAPSGILFVGSRSAGNVYAVKEGKNVILAKNLDMPAGVAFHKGDLFISSISRIVKIPQAEALANELLSGKRKPSALPTPVVIYDKFPDKEHHGWKYLAIGPDEKLYVPVGAPCNVCLEKEPIYATLTRMNLDGSGFEIIAHGIRNSVGFTWNPINQKLWFTDNGRDMMGDDRPPCELNRLDKVSENFGFPYCHGGNIPDDNFTQKPCSDFKAPAQNLGPHVAPLGLKFYTGKTFPKEYQNQIFIAEHGSWNRSKKIGYRITLVRLKDDNAISYEPFATGWLEDTTQENWGRPADILNTPDGDILISDDFANAIYKITYEVPQH